MPRLQIAQPERAIADADQPVHRQIDGRQGAANLAVLALAQADRQPGVGTLNAVQHHLHRQEPLAFDGHAAAQRFQIRIGRVAVDADAILAQPAGGGQFQPALQRAIVGQQQQAFGIEVEPPDRHHARQLFRQVVEHGRAALFIAGRGHQPFGFVIQPQPRRFGFGEGLAIDTDAVLGRHVQRRAVDDAAVDGNLTQFDHPLGLAPRGDTGARQDLGDTLAGVFLGGGRAGGLLGLLGVFFRGHVGHPAAWGGQPRRVFHPRTPESI